MNHTLNITLSRPVIVMPFCFILVFIAIVNRLESCAQQILFTTTTSSSSVIVLVVVAAVVINLKKKKMSIIVVDHHHHYHFYLFSSRGVGDSLSDGLPAVPTTDGTGDGCDHRCGGAGRLPGAPPAGSAW